MASWVCRQVDEDIEVELEEEVESGSRMAKRVQDLRKPCAGRLALEGGQWSIHLSSTYPVGAGESNEMMNDPDGSPVCALVGRSAVALFHTIV